MPLHSARPATSQSPSVEQPAAADATEPAPAPSASATASAASAATASMPIHRPGGAGREQPQRPGRRGPAGDGGGVLARRAGARRRDLASRPRVRLAPAQRAARGGRCRRAALGALPPPQQPRGPVVDERRAPRRAVRRAQRPRPRVQRDDGDDHEPRQRAGHEGAAQQPEPDRSRPARARAGEPPQRTAAATGQQRLGELDLEGESEQHARRPASGHSARCARPARRPRRPPPPARP